MLSKDKILKTLEDHADVLRTYTVTRIGLFGSHLHGDAKEDSDIDLLVDFTEKTFENYMDTKNYLEDLFGCKVDLIPAESLKEALRPTVLKEVEYIALSGV